MTTSVSLHAPPRLRTMFGEQIRAVGLLVQRTGAILVGGLVVLNVIGISRAFAVRDLNLHHAGTTRGPDYAFDPLMSIAVAALGFLLPFVVWQDEGLVQRLYHWAMPVPRHAHAIGRVVGGWTWLMLFTGLYLAGIIVVSAATARITGIPQLPDSGFETWEWIVPFTSATVAYLYSSAAVIGARRPVLWIGSVIAIYFGLIEALKTFDLIDQAKRVAALVVRGDFSLSMAATGNIRRMDPDTLANVPQFWLWIAATLLWGGGAALLCLWTAWRYRDAE